VSKRVLITGASSGIGEAFVNWYADCACDLVLVGRSKSELDRVAVELSLRGVHSEVIIADLSDKNGVEIVGAQCGAVDVLVMNAGVTNAAKIGTSDRDQLDELAYLMSAGIVRLSEIVVPQMVERGGGDVVIVSSIAAFTPMRKAGPYAAAKTYAMSYARSLSLELKEKGVRVVAVCPGYVRTDLHRRAGLDHLIQSVPGWLWLEPNDVVRATARALDRGKTVVVPGLVYRMALPFLTSSFAQRLWRGMTRR
jgi:short-subunit dehydrogenase